MFLFCIFYFFIIDHFVDDATELRGIQVFWSDKLTWVRASWMALFSSLSDHFTRSCIAALCAAANAFEATLNL